MARTLTLLTLALWLTPDAADTVCDEATPESPVLVVGAGLAGLGAALAMEHHGCAVQVVEGRARVGGRAHSVDGGAFHGMDLGGHWIEGNAADKNPIKQLVLDFGLPYSTVSHHPVSGTEASLGDVHVYDESGHRLDRNETLRLIRFWVVQYTRLERLYEHRINSSLPDISLARAVDEVCVGLTEEEVGWTRLLAHWYIGLDDGSFLDTDSLFAWFGEDDNYGWLYDTTDPAQCGSDVLADGYGSLARALAGSLSDGAIRLNTTVTAVAHGGGSVRLTTATGDELACRAAIVTVPLGVLQAGQPAFDPPLSRRQQEGLTRLVMGLENHYYLRYDAVGWPPEDYATGFKAQMPLSGRLLPSWFNAQFESDHAVVGDTRDTPILSAMAQGEWALRSEQLPDDDVARIMSTTAQTMWGADAVDSPTAFLRSAWHADPLARGSYSYYRVGGARPDREAFVPTSADGADGLLFAGEHTCSLLYGTIPGAFVSGLRAAAVALGEQVVANSTWPFFSPQYRDLCDVVMGAGGDDDPHQAGATLEEREARVLQAFGTLARSRHMSRHQLKRALRYLAEGD